MNAERNFWKMKYKEEGKRKEQIDIEEHKKVINRYLQMNGLKLNSLKVTHVSTGKVFVT